MPHVVGILALLFKQFDQERIFDGGFDLLDIFYVTVRPYRLNPLLHLAQNERRRRGGCDRHQRRIAPAVALEHLGFAKLFGQRSRGGIRTFTNQLEHRVVQFSRFPAIERNHLRLQVRVPSECTQS